MRCKQSARACRARFTLEEAVAAEGLGMGNQYALERQMSDVRLVMYVPDPPNKRKKMAVLSAKVLMDWL